MKKFLLKQLDPRQDLSWISYVDSPIEDFNDVCKFSLGIPKVLARGTAFGAVIGAVAVSLYSLVMENEIPGNALDWAGFGMEAGVALDLTQYYTRHIYKRYKVFKQKYNL